MKLFDMIDEWEPGDWPALKTILQALSGDKEAPEKPE